MERLLRPTTAWALAGLVLALSLVLIPLALSAGQNPLVNAGPEIAVAVPFAAVGVTVWAIANAENELTSEQTSLLAKSVGLVVRVTSTITSSESP